MFQVTEQTDWRALWAAGNSRNVETFIARTFAGFSEISPCNGALTLDPAVGVLRCLACGEVVAQGNFNKPHIRKPPAYLSDIRAVFGLLSIIRKWDKTFEFAVEYSTESTVRLYFARRRGGDPSGAPNHVCRFLSDSEIAQSSGGALCAMTVQGVLELYETNVDRAAA